MADVTQLGFDMREVTEALIQKHGVEEGVWSVGIEFGLGAGNAGPSEGEVRPTAFVPVQRILLVRHEGPGNPPWFAVDAATLDSKPAPRRKAKAK